MNDRLKKLPKWAQEYIAELHESAAVQQALRWTEPVEYDVPIPATGLLGGYSVAGSGEYAKVAYSVSSPISHARSTQKPPERTDAQQPIPQYSTRLLAAKACRHQLERVFAAKLAEVDEQIARYQCD